MHLYMSQSTVQSADPAILVVDDSKVSSAQITRLLNAEGYREARFTGSPFQALRSIDKQPADLIIADAGMIAMSINDFLRQVRASDERMNHYSYVVLLGDTFDTQAASLALTEGADDLLPRGDLRAALPLKLQVARRLAARINALVTQRDELARQVHDLRTTDIIDPVTGLGNLKFTLERIHDLTAQVEARGGAACVLLVGIRNLEEIESQHDAQVIDELITGIAAKLRNLVRPLDIVTRPEPNILAVSTWQPDIDNCASHSFRRIFDNLYMHSFRTSEGFIPVVVGVSISAADESTGLPEPKTYMRAAYDTLMQSFETGLITVAQYSPEQAEAHLARWA